MNIRTRKNNLRKSVLAIVLSAVYITAYSDEIEYVDYANPFIGTDNTKQISNGNLYPYIALPWGMNAWTPQTGRAGQGWLYDWKDKKICGFHQTHQPSPWIGDYAQFSVMPIVDSAQVSEDKRASWFSHKTEKSTPAYYKVYLASYDTTVGRHMYKEYNKFGYVPNDPPHGGRSASKTLEYAYADYCIWKLGKALGKPDSETSIYLTELR